jgi:tetratricopeptide (TPR) repeat protein
VRASERGTSGRESGGGSALTEVLLAALLAGAVVAVYGQVIGHGFVEFDDPAYVSENPIVRRGITWEGVRWAFGTGRMGNWHPLTWLSHMLDVHLFGVRPGAHHLVNVALHLANALLLFGVLRRMTRQPWPSLVVAALFALHPLHVESVAWISERKDVLSTLFWFLTLWAYARYADARAPLWYAATVAFFALGLMAKPMLVTVPFVLLLLDLWPLGRYAPWGSTGQRRTAQSGMPPARLLWEKAPLLVLAALCSAVAYATQLREGAIPAAGAVPFGARVSNALVAYVRYLINALWPVDLAVLYPYDTSLPIWQPAAAALALAVISALVLRLAPRHPYALVGWLWYLGTLVPVIGLVQIGSQALADRYTYVPLIGIFIIAAWGGRSLATRWALPAPAVAAVAAGAIAAYAAVAWVQVGLWQSGEVLLAHTVRVTRANSVARNNLGVALAAQGRTDDAMAQFREALEIKPDYADAHTNLGLALWRQGRLEEAAAHYRSALQSTPDAALPHSNLGLVLTEMGRVDEAIVHLSDAVRLDPELSGARVNLGNALRVSGRAQEALEQYELAVQIDPEDAEAHNNIGAMLAQQGRRAEAATRFRTALRHDPRSADAHNNLGLILRSEGRTHDAIEHLRRALEIRPTWAQAHNDLGVTLVDAGQIGEAIKQFEEALRLQPDLPDARINLEIAQAMALESSASGDGAPLPTP